MQPSEYSEIVKLIPPAVGIAILAYFTRFFGKIIADQKPFADNREWDIELSGVMFMIVLAQGVVGIASALYGPHPFSYHTMHIVDLLIVVLAYGFLSLVNAVMSRRFFQLGGEAFNKKIGENKTLLSHLHKIGKHLPIVLVPIPLFYVATIEYLSGSVIWMILIWSPILYIFITLASIFSMRIMDDRTGVDVYFVDPSLQPMKDVMVLKVNDDNIRIRHDNKIHILNKSQVLRMEQKVPDKYLPLDPLTDK
jgi:hypothetical protein